MISIHSEKEFENQAFVLEDNIFIGCRLVACDLIYSGGDFSMTSCQVVNCRIHLRGTAANCKTLFISLGWIPAGSERPMLTDLTQ